MTTNGTRPAVSEYPVAQPLWRGPLADFDEAHDDLAAVSPRTTEVVVLRAVDWNRLQRQNDWRRAHAARCFVDPDSIDDAYRAALEAGDTTEMVAYLDHELTEARAELQRLMDAERAGVSAPQVTPTCVRCDDRGIVPHTGRGSDGYDPCPDCVAPQVTRDQVREALRAAVPFGSFNPGDGVGSPREAAVDAVMALLSGQSPTEGEAS
jgi:hypothetical protein